MMHLENGLVNIENTRMVFRNFEGRAGQYNKEGDRNFCVLLDPEDAAYLENEGFNVQHFHPRDDRPEDIPQAFMRLIVRFDRIPPKIVLITSKNRTVLTEESVGSLDRIRVDHVHVAIHPRLNRNGKYKYTGYLRELYVYVMESYLENKYIANPDTEEAPF